MLNIIWVSNIFLGIISCGLIGVIYYLLKRHTFKLTPNTGDAQNIVDFLNKNVNNYYYIIETKIVELREHIQASIANNEMMLKNFNSSSAHLRNEIIAIHDQLDAIQQYSLDKDNKIRRFEYGYDYKIYDRFIKDIFFMLDSLEKSYANSQNMAILDTINDIKVMLDNNGIYNIDIKPDSIYIGQESIASVDGVDVTDDALKDGLVKEVIKKGFYLYVGERKKIIKPASVIIYKLNKKDQNG
jgi:Uri superfamily endonuclease